MDIIELGAIGEMVGAIAVVATLFYLARQVRGSKQSTDFLTEQAIALQFNQINGQVSANPEVARVWRVGLAHPETLEPDAYVQFHTLLTQYLNVHQSIFDLGRRGLVSPHRLESTVQEMTLHRDLPGMRAVLEGRAFYYDPDFCDLLGVDAAAQQERRTFAAGPSPKTN